MTMSGIKWKDTFCCKTFSVKRHCQFWQFLLRHCWLWDIFSYWSKRHCPLWDIFSYQTFAVFIKKTLSVMRYLQFSDICSFYQKDIVRYEIFSVVRLLQLSDTCSCQTLYIMRHFLWSTYLVVSSDVICQLGKDRFPREFKMYVHTILDQYIFRAEIEKCFRWFLVQEVYMP